MTLNEYQQLAARTINKKLTKQEMMTHAALGLASEAGEVAGIFQKVFQGHQIDYVELVKEAGDIGWFWAELAIATDIDLEYIAEQNIEKLKKRYPEGFSEERSVNREEYQNNKKE